MTEYSVESYELKPIEGDNQIELIIVASDGSRWEYGIPYTPGTTPGTPLHTLRYVAVIVMHCLRTAS